MNLKHRNILMLYYSQEANEDNICGDFNKITIYFEYYFHDLEKELVRRRENGYVRMVKTFNNIKMTIIMLKKSFKLYYTKKEMKFVLSYKKKLKSFSITKILILILRNLL